MPETFELWAYRPPSEVEETVMAVSLAEPESATLVFSGAESTMTRRSRGCGCLVVIIAIAVAAVALLGILQGITNVKPVSRFTCWLQEAEHHRFGGRGGEIGEEAGYYGPGSEGAFCVACQKTRPGASRRKISAQAVALARVMRQSPLERWLAEPSPPETGEARQFFEELVETHAEKKLVTRELLAEEA